MKKNLILLTVSLVLIIGCVSTYQTSTFKDKRDGKTYKTVKIGEQWWFAENLNFVTESGSWCYDNKNNYCDSYGRLYNFKTAINVCPIGWHLSKISDWELLESNLGMDLINADTMGLLNQHSIDSINVGGKLKSASNWKVLHTDVITESGFEALPSGQRNSNGSFSDAGFAAWFYFNENGVYHLSQDSYRGDIWRLRPNAYPDSFGTAFSVRCVKNYTKKLEDNEYSTPKSFAIIVFDYNEYKIYGKVSFRINEGKYDPVIWQAGNLFLFRNDMKMSGDFNAKEAGIIYRVDKESKLLEVGSFDLKDTDEQLKKKYLIK